MERPNDDNIIPFPASFGMNLEKIEEKCLHYLAQASSPLVPVDTLVEFCRRDPECGKLDRQSLLSFLRPHALIQVMEGPDVGDAIDQEAFRKAGINMGPRAILNTRFPAREEMAEILIEQLKDMTDVLVEALNQAKKSGESERIAQLEDTLKKSEALRVKMNKLL